MPTVVFCWELGGGNGHVGPFEPLARRFIRDGWSVVLIVRDLSRIRSFFQAGEVQAFQAPVKLSPPRQPIAEPVTFGHLLRNMGYDNVDELSELLGAWRRLIQKIEPELLLFNHCPTGLLATRGLSVPRATLGHGFYIPKDEEPLAPMSPWRTLPLETLKSDERELLSTINAALQENSIPQLPRLGAMFSEVDRTLLTTFRELDHVQNREGASYLGSWSTEIQQSAAAPPKWPFGIGPRIFAYLKRFAALPDLLAGLTHYQVPTIAVFDDVDVELFRSVIGPNICVSTRPLSLKVIAQTCDAAILTGGHSTVCQFLLAGRPQLIIPRTLEQAVTASRVSQLNAGLQANQETGTDVARNLTTIVRDPARFNGAQGFRERYSNWSESTAISQAFQELTAL